MKTCYSSGLAGSASTIPYRVAWCSVPAVTGSYRKTEAVTFQPGIGHCRAEDLASDEHFSVDGTWIETWTPHKHAIRIDGSGANRPAGCSPEIDLGGTDGPTWPINAADPEHGINQVDYSNVYAMF